MPKFIINNSKVEYRIELDPRMGHPFPSLKKFLRGNSKDVLNKLNGIFTLVPGCASYLEPMAGAGISAGLVRELFNPEMFLNDTNDLCVEMLRERFPKATIFHEDAQSTALWEKTPAVDVVFMDNSSLTLRRLDSCIGFSMSKANNTFLYTDTFPFSIIPFDESRLITYLQEVNEWMKERGFQVGSVYLYDNHRVMIVRADRNPTQELCLVKPVDPFKHKRLEGLFE